MKILVIIPTYNEVDNICNLVKSILSINSNINALVVDDNSPDGTSNEVKKLIKKNKRAHLIKREKKDGRGSAVLEGIKYGIRSRINYDKIVEMDADFSHRPEDFMKLIDKSKSADVVIGSRYHPESKILNWPLRRKIISRLSNIYARLILGIPIKDYTNGYRVYSRKAADVIIKFNIKLKGYIVLSEIAYKLYKQGFTFAEVPTVFINRKKGESNTNFRELLGALLGIIKIKFKRE